MEKIINKSYFKIPHLSISRLGSSDKMCDVIQEKIATQKLPDDSYEVIVTEKIDGSNVGIYKKDNILYPILKSGYHALTSPHIQHKYFTKWCYKNFFRLDSLLEDGERLIGEWILQAHGTIYKFDHEPFIALDIMKGDKRLDYDSFLNRVSQTDFIVPHMLHRGSSISVNRVENLLGVYGHHGAEEPSEGAVWRIQRYVSGKDIFNFMVKYVRKNKKDGKYFKKISGNEEIFLYDYTTL